MRERISGLLAGIDRLDWTASGAERWLASATIATLGVLSGATQVVYLRWIAPATTATLLIPAIPLFLSVLIVVASTWLPRSEYGRFLPRVALWCLGGAVVLVAVGQLVVLSQRPLGTRFDAPLFVLAYMQTIGTAIGLVIGLYDAGSERTKRELDAERERAERYSQQLSVLNRILRHDVRTGVQVIREYADLLPDPPDVEPTVPLDRIQNRAEKMYETAQTARELEQLMGTPEELTDHRDVSEAVESAVDTVREVYPDARIRITEREPAPVTASRIVDLAFKELITNAVEHNDGEPRRVEISCESTRAAVVVRIADNGPGIPDAEVEPLRQGEETALVHGSGIGLWLANWIVEVSDGSLTFDGNEYGGTTVTVRLPR